MQISIKNKTINIVLKTKKIIDIANTLKEKNFEEAFFKAKNSTDLDALSKIIYTLAEDENGKKPFKTSSDVFDFIDDYKKEAGKTYIDMYNELTEYINNECFFNKKMTSEELEQKTNGLMSSINIENIAKNAIEKVVEKEFQGFEG